jgi:hypothetical protein
MGVGRLHTFFLNQSFTVTQPTIKPLKMHQMQFLFVNAVRIKQKNVNLFQDETISIT